MGLSANECWLIFGLAALLALIAFMALDTISILFKKG
jgi:hypothetical protein